MLNTMISAAIAKLFKVKVKAPISLVLVCLVSIIVANGCSPMRKLEQNFPGPLAMRDNRPKGAPPNPNLIPLPRQKDENADGYAGTAADTPGIKEAWAVAYGETIIMGVTFDPWVKASQMESIKLAAVGRALDSHTQLVVIKITSDPQKVATIKSISQSLSRGADYSKFVGLIKGISKEIPAIDQDRPR